MLDTVNSQTFPKQGFCLELTEILINIYIVLFLRWLWCRLHGLKTKKGSLGSMMEAFIARPVHYFTSVATPAKLLTAWLVCFVEWQIFTNVYLGLLLDRLTIVGSWTSVGGNISCSVHFPVSYFLGNCQKMNIKERKKSSCVLCVLVVLGHCLESRIVVYCKYTLNVQAINL